MSTDEDTLKRRYREFLELMPLTIAIAGLPHSDGPYNYNADQLEVRTRNAGDGLQIGSATRQRSDHRRLRPAVRRSRLDKACRRRSSSGGGGQSYNSFGFN